jgi:hypothetical protein
VSSFWNRFSGLTPSKPLKRLGFRSLSPHHAKVGVNETSPSKCSKIEMRPRLKFSEDFCGLFGFLCYIPAPLMDRNLLSKPETSLKL